jgi:hypothetical protein
MLRVHCQSVLIFASQRHADIAAAFARRRSQCFCYAISTAGGLAGSGAVTSFKDTTGRSQPDHQQTEQSATLSRHCTTPCRVLGHNSQVSHGAPPLPHSHHPCIPPQLHQCYVLTLTAIYLSQWRGAKYRSAVPGSWPGQRAAAQPKGPITPCRPHHECSPPQRHTTRQSCLKLP